MHYFCGWYARQSASTLLQGVSDQDVFRPVEVSPAELAKEGKRCDSSHRCSFVITSPANQLIWHRWATGLEPQGWLDQYDLMLRAVIRISKSIKSRMNGSMTKSDVEIVLDHFSKEEFCLAVEGLVHGVYSACGSAELA
jgi:hypothetical protein